MTEARFAGKTTTPKKATNVSISSGLLVEARNLKINLSATLEKALVKEVREVRARLWREDNRDAIGRCNKISRERGLFADRYRVF
jgi:antitoxin CcdA